MYGVLFSTAGFAGARAGGFELGRNGKGKTGVSYRNMYVLECRGSLSGAGRAGIHM